MGNNKEFYRILEKLQSLKKAKKDTPEFKNLTQKAYELAFKTSCVKTYLSACEPEYCSFRYTNECKYFEMREQIIKTLN